MGNPQIPYPSQGTEARRKADARGGIEVLGAICVCPFCAKSKKHPEPHRLLRVPVDPQEGFKNTWHIVCETEGRVLAEISFDDVEPVAWQIARLIDKQSLRMVGRRLSKNTAPIYKYEDDSEPS